MKLNESPQFKIEVPEFLNIGVACTSKHVGTAKENSTAMIIEDELQPFEKVPSKGLSTKDMHIHDLPWPKDQLLALGATPVKMTVTLSYFIEPNPSSRNISTQYRYPSHQFRFDVKAFLQKNFSSIKLA